MVFWVSRRLRNGVKKTAMKKTQTFEIFLVVPPGLEQSLWKEDRAKDFPSARYTTGGVTLKGGWEDVWRANLVLRGATRVLVRIGEFRAFHLAQLDKRCHKFEWNKFLRPDVPVRVEAVTNKKSKIYHAGAAKERVERSISNTLGAEISDEAEVTVKLRIESNLCVFSLDTSGEALHKRGHKAAVGKAPMRETLAALFLGACGYDGQEPVLDPMCGSGTFVLEAAEIATGMIPGRARKFAFEKLATFDSDDFAMVRASLPGPQETSLSFFGSDRNAGAIDNATANAERAGLSSNCHFRQAAISNLLCPEGDSGLVIINPPYGARISNKKQLFALYASLGAVLRERFSGWRVGLVTTDGQLARATKLPLLPESGPIDHGGLRVKLYQTDALP